MELGVISSKFNVGTLDEIVEKAGFKKHISWRFGSGFKKGDSYLSEVYRLIIEVEDENGSKSEISVIAKSIPKNVGRRKTFRSDDFFRNEIYVYKVIFPKFDEFFKKRNATLSLTELIPRCFSYYVDGVNDFIVLEDLSKDGYRGAVRQNGLDLDHCKLILETLGKFHAISLAVKDQEPEEFKKILESLEETYYDDKFRNWYIDFSNDQIVTAIDAVTKEYGGTVYETKMREFIEDNLFDKMVKYTHTTGPFSVINHGDCWTPNFLMQYANDEKLISSKMIDFQLARYVSPALDISFFIYSCTTHSLRESHYDELLQSYYQAAKDALLALGSDPEKVFPYAALLNEMKTFARFGVGMGIESIPMTVLNDEDICDLDSIAGNEAVPINQLMIIRPIKNKEDRLRLADIFKHAVDTGYLD